MTKAAIQILFQRAGGWCKPVQDRVFPLFESAVKAARFVSFIIRFERSPKGGNMGGNAEEITFRPSADVSMLTEGSTGAEGFCVIRARGSVRRIHRLRAISYNKIPRGEDSAERGEHD